MKCAIHPNVETVLSCGKCGQPICPKCMVETPVGAKCPACARLQKLPVYNLSASHYLKAMGTALGMAVACGLLWGLISIWSPFNLNLILAPAAGYVIAEVISRAVNRKRGKTLAVIASTALVLSYLVSLPLQGGFPFMLKLLIDIVALGLGVWIVVNTLR